MVPIKRHAIPHKSVDARRHRRSRSCRQQQVNRAPEPCRACQNAYGCYRRAYGEGNCRGVLHAVAVRREIVGRGSYLADGQLVDEVERDAVCVKRIFHVDEVDKPDVIVLIEHTKRELRRDV